MLNKVVSENPSSLGWGWGYLCPSELPSNLVGKILTIVESFGLRESQEKSAKQIIEQTIWGLFAYQNNHGVEDVPNGLHSELRRVLFELKQEQNKAVARSVKYPSQPMVVSDYSFKVSYEKK